jgi:hypothetical protein
MRLALDIDPTNPTLLADLGQLHYFAGELQLAREQINRSLAIDKNHPFASGYIASIEIPTPAAGSPEMLRDFEGAKSNSFTLPFINVDPKFDAIRDTPRVQKVLRDIDLAR